jgi:excisionase family DNA binding protein
MHTQLYRRPSVPRLSYTLPEFCEATGLSRTAAYVAIAKGELKSFKSGRRRFIRATAADAWIATRESCEPRQNSSSSAQDSKRNGRRVP